MRFLLLNQFYPPDTAATGQLLEDVAHALARAGHEVHVVCSRGAYGGGIVPAPRVTRQEAGLWVHRVSAVSEGRNRFLGRLSDWGSYYAAALAQSICLARCDACLALTTPPFIGIVGALLKALKGTRLVLWTMDIWPEVAVALGAIPANGHVAAALRSFAKWTYDASSRIISLGPVMTERLCALGVARAKITNAHNWVPGEVVTPQPWSPATCVGQPKSSGRFVLMYSGNMGLPHEFDTILAAAELLREDRSILFSFVGDGSRRREVEQEVRRKGMRNVRFQKPVPLSGLSQLLASGDVHLVSMRKGLEGLVVPSKIYGILAAGRPAIMVGSTQNEIAQLLTDSKAGFVVENGRAEELAAVIRNLRDQPDVVAQMGQAGRRYYEQHLGRVRSVAAIINLLANPDSQNEKTYLGRLFSSAVPR